MKAKRGCVGKTKKEARLQGAPTICFVNTGDYEHPLVDPQFVQR